MATIRFAEVAPGRAFHAVLAATRLPAEEHGHDFVELMLVVEGEGRHRLNGAWSTLVPGRALRLGPADRHAIVPSRGGMAWINVAFPAESWAAFVALAGFEPPVEFLAARAPFERAVRAYHAGEGGLALAAFLAESASPPPSPPAPGPPWLARALAPETVLAGVPAMREAACVCAPHLSRAVRAATGRSPTELVNEERLAAAALRLATTTDEIAQVALDCGFPSLSYFYRAFRRRHGATPLEWRRRAQAPPGVPH